MTHEQRSEAVRSVAVIGNFLPRHCGIATFTADLVTALGEESLGLSCGVVAMNDIGKRYSYDETVLFEISEGDIASYSRAADFLNVGGFDVISLQHEYGIFGGRAGAHVLGILEQLRVPLVTTLHTILRDPTVDQRRVMDSILRLSTRLVVMSETGAALLSEVYGVAPGKIDLIHHGIPSLPDREASRKKLRVEDNLELLTSGLLSPDKGLEYVIDALPSVVKQFPQLRYMIVGATHPQVRESQGEAYRLSLQLRVSKLGLDDHVVFHDRFVSARELGEFISAADVYLTPYLNPEQITSGTLSYAAGSGKPVISTPYAHAREVLAEDRGILVPYRDSNAISQALVRLLQHPDARAELGARSGAMGKGMSWPSVAARYKASFGRAQGQFAARRRNYTGQDSWRGPQIKLPELNLRHIQTLTDDTGILQHAIFSVPRYEDGYCIDDNARALLLSTLSEEFGSEDRTTTRRLATRYLAFINHAFDRKTSRFRNFMDFTRTWTEQVGSEDSQGRTIWALGAVVGRTLEPGRKSLARQLFRLALPPVREFTSPRACAFALLGIAEYMKAFQGDREIQGLQRSMADQLLSRFSRNFDTLWPWCEDSLTYDNARLPQALIVSGTCLEDQELVDSGVGALTWLSKIQLSENGNFSPIGSDGFFSRDATRARFDQQPVDACATVAACLEAWRATRNEHWAREMWHAFSWFLGENDVNAALYDPSTGGCRDGLHADSVNENQGAESTLSFLLALVDMRALIEEMHFWAQEEERTTTTSTEDVAS